MLLCLSLVPSAFSKDGDLQLWTTQGVEAKINDSLKVKAENEQRYKDDITAVFHNHTDVGFTLKVNDNLDLGLNYRLTYEKKAGKWKDENRPHFNGTLKWDLYGFKLKNRGRVELRIPEDGSDKWRFRNRLTLTYPVKWTDFKIQPYVADEIFIDFHKDKFTRNRLYAGFGLKPFKHLKADLFYMLQTSKKSRTWSDANVIGLKLNAVF